MLVTYRTLKNVTFPAYLLHSSNWDLRDGMLFLDNQVLDDRNMPGDTLGKRRLQTPFRGLYQIKKAVMSPVGIVKQSNQAYIDNLGKIFIYEKTRMVPLKYHKIRKVELKETYSLVWIMGFNFSFKVPRPPKSEYTWAGVLHVDGFPWLLYEYSKEKLKDTQRKI